MLPYTQICVLHFPLSQLYIHHHKNNDLVKYNYHFLLQALLVWSELITEKAVPLSRQHQVLKLVLGRLQDKSLVVRKNAVQLLTAFIKGNPFAAKVNKHIVCLCTQDCICGQLDKENCYSCNVIIYQKKVAII